MSAPYDPPKRPDGIVNFNDVLLEDLVKIPRSEFLKVDPNFDKIDAKGCWRDKNGKQLPTPCLKSTKLKAPYSDKAT